MARFFTVFFLLLAQTSVTAALSTSPVTTKPKSFERQSCREERQQNLKACSGRRAFFKNASLVLPMVLSIDPAIALDVDAFMNKELDTDNKKTKLTDDEALCKFGSPSKETGNACVRAGLSTARAKGGVDAYGNVDRGDFVRCQTSYPMVDGKYVKTVICK